MVLDKTPVLKTCMQTSLNLQSDFKTLDFDITKCNLLNPIQTSWPNYESYSSHQDGLVKQFHFQIKLKNSYHRDFKL